MQKLADHEQGLNALSQANVIDTIEESVQVNMINKVKNQLPKFVPAAVSDFIKPHHEQGLNALSQANVIDTIEESVQVNMINKVKNQLPKFVPAAVSDFIKPHKIVARGELDLTPTLRKDTGESSSRKCKAHQESTNYERFADADEPIQEQEVPTKVFGGKCSNWFKQHNEKDSTNDAHEQSWFNELVDVEKDLGEFELQKGNKFHNDLSKPLPLEGPPNRKTIPTRYFFSNKLEYLKHGNTEKKYALSLSKIYVAKYKEEDMHLLKIQDKIHHLDGSGKLPNEAQHDKATVLQRCDGTLSDVCEKLKVMLTDNVLGFDNANSDHCEWTKKDVKRTKTMIKKIGETLKEIRHMEGLKALLEAEETKMTLDF
nr:hypothetical protein [Tanacetum cinerariifolium]